MTTLVQKDSTQVRSAPRLHGAQLLDRANSIMRLLAAHQTDGMSLSMLVAKTGLDRTTTYRIASSLVESGMASRDPQKRYRLGIETMALGMASMKRPPLIDLCAPMMQAIARRSGGHVLLSIQSGDYSHCLHMELPERQIPGLRSYVGTMRLLGAGISGVALLARVPDKEVHAHYSRHVTEYHDHAMTEGKLQRVVAQTRSDDFVYLTPREIAGVGICFETGSCGLAGLNVIALASQLPRSAAPAVASMMREHLTHIPR